MINSWPEPLSSKNGHVNRTFIDLPVAVIFYTGILCSCVSALKDHARFRYHKKHFYLHFLQLYFATGFSKKNDPFPKLVECVADCYESYVDAFGWYPKEINEKAYNQSIIGPWKLIVESQRLILWTLILNLFLTYLGILSIDGSVYWWFSRITKGVEMGISTWCMHVHGPTFLKPVVI